MDHTEIKVEMAEEGLLERLVITEEGEMTEGVIDRGTASGSLVIVQSCSRESALKQEEQRTGGDKNEDSMASKMCLEGQQTEAEDDETEEVFVTEEDKQERNVNDGQNSESEGQTHEMLRNNEKPEKPSDTEDEKVTQNDPKVDFLRLFSSEHQPEGTDNQEEDSKKVCGLLFYFHMP